MMNWKTILLLVLFPVFTQAQNLDKIGDKDMVTVHGGFNLNTITYASNGTSYVGRDPFTWFASGNITVNFLDVSLPFTYTYSNRVGRFTQPFNMVALHPKYKWVQGHVGITSMNFSKYTLANHIFAGAGADLTPGKWKISFMGGRLNKAVQYDPVVDNVNQIAFQRWGYGLKAGYANNGHELYAIAFKGYDQVNSLLTIPLNSEVNPQDNVVLSMGGKTKLPGGFNLEAEYAVSGLTQSLTDVNPSEGTENLSFLNPLIQANSTTDFFQAYNGAVSYQMDKASVAVKYEHIDPGYKTLGGYFFNNDLENYTIAPSFRLLKNKMNVSANAGFQKNNLGGDKSATTKRWIGSTNISYAPGPKLVLNGSYSNFSTFTRNRPVTDPFYFQPADTLNFYQLSQNASAAVMLQPGKQEAKVKGTIQALYNYQESTSMSGNIMNAGAFGSNVGLEGIPTYVHSGNLAYVAQFVESKTGVTLASNINQTIILDQVSLYVGPTLNLQKMIAKEKVSLAVGTTYNRQYKNSILSNNVWNHRVSLSHAIKMKKEAQGRLNLSLNANYMQKLAIVTTENNMSEMNVFANLNYSF